MPSSLIWVALVVGWVLVLFPMISGRRLPVSRTGAATEETRILHRGGKPRPARRGPATGHLSDPEWQPSPEEQARRASPKSNDPKTAPVEAQMDSAGKDSDDHALADADVNVAPARRFAAGTSVVLDAIVVGEEDAADAEFTADSAEKDRGAETVAADPVAEDADEHSVAETVAEDPVAEDADDSILATVPVEAPVQRSGRGGFDPEADAAARAVRYRNRQRTVLGLAGATVVSIAGAMIFSALLAWVAVLLGVLLVGYMSYLRQQSTSKGGHYAVIADEAHSSQTGMAASKLKAVLSPEEQESLADGGTDLVVLNPPFHVGAAVVTGAADHLFSAAARVLRPGGELWTVYNSALRYKPELARVVGPTRLVEQTPKFSVTVSTRR